MMKRYFMMMAMFPLLVGCLVIPLNSPLQTVSVLLRANFNDAYETKAAKMVYVKANVFHLRIELWKGGTKVAAKEVLNADLGNPVTIKNLVANTTYQVRCFAYYTADESVPISLDDANSHTDIFVTNDDALTINSIKVKLIDTPFGSQGTGSIAITDGVLLPCASESFL